MPQQWIETASTPNSVQVLLTTFAGLQELEESACSRIRRHGYEMTLDGSFEQRASVIGQRVLGPVKVTLHCRAETPELGLMLTSFSPKGFRFLSLANLPHYDSRILEPEPGWIEFGAELAFDQPAQRPKTRHP
ncbi:hypothetical protein I7I51_02662 [Histoplasma capsulatum]|uniref:Uncharacterized protein n=1 Tax=Ajellomyces capsulatus TaxID=5037 RepID=A0A8A1MAE4_AJECA|nr:hypothetical protein I7I51_02662 [Histoplasma capsulatum]